MAITKTIEIDIESSKSEKKVEGLITQFTDLGKEASISIKKIQKGVENTEKSTGKLAAAFITAGLALKAMGVGLVIEAFNILKDLFQSNQKIADVFGTSMKALSVVFNDLFNFIFDNVDSVKDFFKAIFEDPIGSLKQLGQLIKENIIERFKSALEVAGFLSDALVNLFKGDFDAALNSVKEAGKEMVDVFTGVDDTVGKVGKLADAVGKYAGEVWNSSAALQAQENAAKRAEAIQAGLVEQYDRQAEKLRQIRDNDLISIEDRIKANEELGKVLDEQEKAMLKQAQLQVQAAANQYNLNKSIENEVALINARNNVKGVEAQIEGFRSEQQSNKNALDKEAKELTKSRLETELELAINQKKFDAERLVDIKKKYEANKLITEQEIANEKFKLEEAKKNYVEGTQARVDAENEFLLKKQELDNALVTQQAEFDNYNFKLKTERLQETANLENEAFSTRLSALQQYNTLVQQSDLYTEEEKRKVQNETFKQEQALNNQRLALTAQTAGNIANILGQNSKAGKAFAVAQALINTYQGITAELATKTATPFEFGIKLANIATTAAIGFKTVKDILKTNPSPSASPSASSTSGGGGAPSMAPQFNVVGNSGVNQIAETLGQQQPVQAYVVANNVTTAQSMDRNIIQNASLG
jgi:hypothetical protein